jgi:adenylyltransferase/sulfurtransferase
MSCNLLAHEDVTEGKIPTTPTISSIIAGIQVQEAVKLIHGMPTLAGRGFIFEGLNHTSYKVEYTESPSCMSHYTLPQIVKLDERSEDLTLHELWERAKSDLAESELTVEFSRDVIQKLVCPQCGAEESLFVPVGSVSYEDGQCRIDGHIRVVHAAYGYDGSQSFGQRSLSELGLPRFDIFTARSSTREIGYLLNDDRETVLGPLARGGA